MNRGGVIGSISAIFDEMSKNNEAHTLLCVAEIEGVPDPRLICERVKNLSYGFPTFSSVVREKEGIISPYKVWIPQKINYDEHLEVLDLATFRKSRFDQLLTKILNARFTEGIPEWKFHYVMYGKSNRSFFVVKISHVYGDGAMISHIFRSLCDGKAELGREIKRPHSSFFYKIYAIFMILSVIVRYLLERNWGNNTRISVDCSDTKESCYIDLCRWKLSELKEISRRKMSSINDIMSAVLFRAVSLYDGKADVLSSMSIFNMRRHMSVTSMDDTNDIGVLFIPVSTANRTSSEILPEVRRLMGYYKHSPMIYLLSYLMKVIYSVCPRALVEVLGGLANKSTFGFSNYATLLSDLTIGDCSVLSLRNVVKPYKMGVFFSALSYGDSVSLCAGCKVGNLEDVEMFRGCLKTAYEEISI